MLYQQAEVERGITLLDEKKPGWRDRFDPEKLDMFNVFGCVLGQVFGNYEEGLFELNVPVLRSEEYGFTLRGGSLTPDENVLTSFEQLTATWRTLAAV